MENIEKRVVKLEHKVEFIEKEQTELKDVLKETRNIAKSVAVMANEMIHVKDDVKDIKKTIAQHHTEEPNKLIFNAKNAIIVGVISTVLGAIFALIFK